MTTGDLFKKHSAQKYFPFLPEWYIAVGKKAKFVYSDCEEPDFNPTTNWDFGETPTLVDLWLKYPEKDKERSKQPTPLRERDEKTACLEAARTKFEKLLPELLKKYEGQYVALVDNFVEIHEDKENLLKMVIEKYGYRSMYLGQITRKQRVVRMRSPRIKNR